MGTGAIPMPRARALRWIFEHLADFINAAWHGDKLKIAVLAAVLVIAVLGFWYDYARDRRREREREQKIDDIFPEDRWTQPSLDEVMNALRTPDSPREAARRGGTPDAPESPASARP